MCGRNIQRHIASWLTDWNWWKQLKAAPNVTVLCPSEDTRKRRIEEGGLQHFLSGSSQTARHKIKLHVPARPLGSTVFLESDKAVTRGLTNYSAARGARGEVSLRSRDDECKALLPAATRN